MIRTLETDFKKVVGIRLVLAITKDMPSHSSVNQFSVFSFTVPNVEYIS